MLPTVVTVAGTAAYGPPLQRDSSCTMVPCRTHSGILPSETFAHIGGIANGFHC